MGMFEYLFQLSSSYIPSIYVSYYIFYYISATFLLFQAHSKVYYTRRINDKSYVTSALPFTYLHYCLLIHVAVHLFTLLSTCIHCNWQNSY